MKLTAEVPTPTESISFPGRLLAVFIDIGGRQQTTAGKQDCDALTAVDLGRTDQALTNFPTRIPD